MTHFDGRQWRVQCDCVTEVAQARVIQPWGRMHSRVSKTNTTYFIEEDRLGEALSEDDLLGRLKNGDGTLLSCNVWGEYLRAADDLPDRYYPGGRLNPDDVEYLRDEITGETRAQADRSVHMNTSRKTLIVDGGSNDD